MPSTRTILQSLIAVLGSVLVASFVAWAMGVLPPNVFDVGPNDAIFDPNDRNATSGGRVNGLSVDPSNDDILFAASEFGGIFKTFDGALNWTQLDGHRPQATWDVMVNPGNTGVIYATSLYDGRTTPLSGINVSTDGGVSWAHPPTSEPTATVTNCSAPRVAQPRAYGIGVVPDQNTDVYVGTNCSVAISTNMGTTWNHVVPTSATIVPGDNQVWDVFAQAGGIIDICGNDGHHRFDGTVNNNPLDRTQWTGTSSLPFQGRCSIVSSPLEPNVLYVTGTARVYESRNAGQTWTPLDETSSTTKRVPFVETIATGANTFDLYWGDGFKLRRVNCDNSSTPRCPAGNVGNGDADMGTNITNGAATAGDAHDDTGDVAFTSDSCPRYFSNDGGVFRNENCPGNVDWKRRMSGMHSMWVWDMDGSTDVNGASGPAINFGLQDDGVWHSPDGAATWDSLDCCDGFDNVVDEERAVFTVCCFAAAPATQLFAKNADGSGGVSGLPEPPGNMRGFQFADSLDQFGPDSYVAVTSTGVYITTDVGSSWSQIGAASTPGSACGVLASVSLGTPFFYLLAGDCNANLGDGNAGVLWRYSGTGANGTWTRADNGLNDIGVYAVHKTQPNRLLASDQAGPTRMVMSEDGGLSWNPLPSLDVLMTGGGEFVLSPSLGPGSSGGTASYSQPSLVDFHPADDNVLIAGARDAGLFLSADRGISWSLVTDRISQPWHSFVDTATDSIYVGTRGRGVYRVDRDESDLGVTKSDSPDPVHAGDQLYYTITVENFGPADALDATILDDLPDEVSFVTDDLDICVDNAGIVSCNFGDLLVGETATVVIKTHVSADTVVNAGQPTSIQNKVTVSSTSIVDTNPANDMVVIGTIVEDSADLAVTKLCVPDREINAGEIATCTIIVDNYGPSDARDVVALDALASEGNFQIVGAPIASQGGPCFVWGSTWTCNLGPLPAATASIEGRATIEVQITSDEQVDIADLSKVVSDTPDPFVGNNESSDIILVSAVADLSLAKTDSVDPVVAGENLTYTLSLANGGPSEAQNVVVADVVPSGVTIVSVSASGGASCNAGVPGDPFLPTTCSFGTLADGAARSMTVNVTVDPETRGALINDARISSDTLDVDSSDDLASETTSVDAEADLSIAKADLQDPVIAGEILDYELTVINNGPSSSRNVVVTDVLPAEITFVNATVLDGSGTCTLADPPTNTVECHIGEILPNAGVPVFIDVKGHVAASTPDGSLQNQASVTSTETLDPAAGNDVAVEDTTVITEADIVIDKTSNQDTYKPSAQVIYTIEVFNMGSSDAQNVQVTDVLPTQKHDFLLDTAGCSGGETGTLTCDLGTIAAGDSTAFNVHIKMKGASGVIVDTASVTTSTTDPDLVNNTDVLENLVKGGTQEGGGSGPGQNGSSPDEAFSLLAADASCGPEKGTIAVDFQWILEDTDVKNPRLDVSSRSDYSDAHTIKTKGSKATSVLQLDQATVYHWQLRGNGRRGKKYVSESGRFVTPTCRTMDYVDIQ
jgi:uncharacterized repeat protein (TIGR01451 family)